MNKDNTIPNKKIRSILLLCVLVVYVATTVYVVITKDNNKLVGSYHDYDVYEDKYDDYDDHDDYDDYDDYDDEYDDYYDDEEQDEVLSTSSYQVTSLYSYIKYYPYVTGIKENFKVAELTEEEKMSLIAASLKSKNSYQSTPVVDVEETTLQLNNKVYTASVPNIRYERYLVVNMYSDVFGSSSNMNFSTIMYDGDNIAYKYNESANGYIKYVAQTETPTTIPNPEILKAEKKSGNIEITLKVGNNQEKYIFEPISQYSYLYKLTERTTTKLKNSL